MRVAVVVVAVLLSSAILLADDHTVLFDHDVDFGVFRTFTVQDGTIGSRRPELNSPITIKNLTDAIRRALLAQGLTEAPNGDLVIESRVLTTEYGVSRGMARPMNEGQSRGRRGAAPPLELREPDFTDATLVIDLTARSSSTLVWRGVYNDSERDGIALVRALPRNAATLLSQYPSKPR